MSIKVFCCNVENFNINEKAFSLLSSERKKRLKTAKNKNACACAELLLYYALGKRADYRRLENGKPVFENGEGYFSLSHSGSYVACAISQFPVGVDIQLKTEYNENTARRICSATELSYINGSEDKEEAFLNIWVQKEAYAKMNGNGISEILKRTEPENTSSISLNGLSVGVCGAGDICFNEIKTEQLAEFIERMN